MGFLKKKSAQYKAAIRVDKYRVRAVELREHDPDTFAQMLASADRSEAEGVAQRDPVAYVALLMAAWDDSEAGGDESVAAQRDIDYWPTTLDLDAAWAELVEGFLSNPAQQPGETIYYARERVRRMVALSVMEQVGSIDPKLLYEFVWIFNVGDPEAYFKEDPELDKRFDRFLLENHLSQIMEAFVQGLAAEEGLSPTRPSVERF
jgi:hypothetical protein